METTTEKTNPSTPHVLVGVDGSPNSLKALRLGLQEATWRGIGCRALIAWTYPVMYGMEGGVYAVEPATLETSASVALDEAIVAAFPDVADQVKITRFTIGGPPAETLIEESKRAALLVIGARGHGGFMGLLLGSISSQVVKHAHCPVLVVHPD